MVYGIGYNTLPRGLATTQYKREYYLWKSMLFRCTRKFQEKHPTYNGVSVDDRWKNFANFLEDIETLDGYELWKNKSNETMMLDKDTKVKGNKIYSKDTCCFLSHSDSNRDVHNRHPESIKIAKEKFVEVSSIKVVAINKKTKEYIIYDSMKECHRQLYLNFRQIWMCLSKEDKYKSHKSCHGYIFIYYDEFDSSKINEYIEKSKYNH